MPDRERPGCCHPETGHHFRGEPSTCCHVHVEDLHANEATPVRRDVPRGWVVEDEDDNTGPEHWCVTCGAQLWSSDPDDHYCTAIARIEQQRREEAIDG